MGRLRLVLAVLVTFALANAAPVTASEPTKTSVNVPIDPLFKLVDGDSPTSLHVEGTTTGGSPPDSVTVKCVPNTGTPSSFGPLSIDGTGAFAGDVNMTNF